MKSTANWMPDRLKTLKDEYASNPTERGAEAIELLTLAIAQDSAMTSHLRICRIFVPLAPRTTLRR